MSQMEDGGRREKAWRFINGGWWEDREKIRGERGKPNSVMVSSIVKVF